MGTDEYKKLMEAINQIEQGIDSLKKSLSENKNSIQALREDVLYTYKAIEKMDKRLSYIENPNKRRNEFEEKLWRIGAIVVIIIATIAYLTS